MQRGRPDALERGKRMLSRLRAQKGFTMVEVLASILLLSIGLLVTVDALVHAGGLGHGSQRQAQAAAYAESQLEQVRQSALTKAGFLALGLSSAPTHAALSVNFPADKAPNNPDYYVAASGSCFTVLADFRDYTSTAGPGCETLITGGSALQTSAIPSSTGIAGTVYRYITYPTCAFALAGACVANSAATTNEKRITIAVVLSNTVNGPKKPVYVSSTVTNPSTCPLGLPLPLGC